LYGKRQLKKTLANLAAFPVADSSASFGNAEQEIERLIRTDNCNSAVMRRAACPFAAHDGSIINHQFRKCPLRGILMPELVDYEFG